MPLTDCPDCGRPVSTSARACPNCGCPVAEKLGRGDAPPPTAGTPPADPNQLLAEVRPSWWGYFWHLVFFFLIVPPVVAWFRRHSTVLRIFPERIRIEHGIFSKSYQDYNPRDIRSIDVDQSFIERVLGIGTLTISTAATVEAAEQIQSIPDPQDVRDLILAQRGNR